MRKFVLATDLLSAEEEKKLQEALELGTTMGWWHWLPNFWLLSDATDTWTATKITNALHRINSTKRALAIEVTPTMWSALTKPDSQGRDMVEWIRKSWEQ